MKAGKNKATSSGGEYRFMKEKIKRKPFEWKRSAGRIAVALGMGILFGAAASLTMEILRPVFAGVLGKESEEKNLSLNVEQNKTEENKENKEIVGSAKIEKGVVTDLQNLEAGIYQIAENAKPFIVDVIGIKEEPDWFEETSSTENQSPGIIVNMEENVLILTDRNAVKSVNYIQIRFCDGTIAQGHEIAYDFLTNLSIIQVDSITEETRNSIRAASFLGEDMAQGDLVLALGRPLGKFGTVVYGHIAGQKMEKYTDATYRQIYTDIAGSTKAQGILINEQGQVLGLINQKLAAEGSESLITAIGTQELQNLVEKLMRGENPGYLGIEGESFSSEKADAKYKGSGIYVTKLRKDLPAMAAGIRGGDILTEIGGKKVTNMAEFQREILKHAIGDKVSVTLVRQGRGEYQEMTLEVEIGGY